MSIQIYRIIPVNGEGVMEFVEAGYSYIDNAQHRCQELAAQTGFRHVINWGGHETTLDPTPLRSYDHAAVRVEFTQLGSLGCGVTAERVTAVIPSTGQHCKSLTFIQYPTSHGGDWRVRGQLFSNRTEAAWHCVSLAQAWARAIKREPSNG